MRVLVATAVVSLSVFVFAERADACGGLFCSGTSPVDQSAEQVLFEIEPDGTISATVQVQYSGDPAAFSWIIPVHGTPDFVDVAPGQLFRWLDATTRPQLLPPPGTCNDFDSVDADDGSGTAPPSPVAEGGVNVVEYEDVGPYDEIVVVDGRDPDELVTWLTEHGYLVTDAMRPVIEEYALENQKFLAVRLQPDAAVTEIVPIRFHCPNPLPVVPSRLTALAAEPHMGMVVTILATQRYTSANWVETEVLDSEIVWDWNTWRSNYTTAVALRVDEVGGQGFVVERAGPSQLIADLINQQIANNTWDGEYQGDPTDLDVVAYLNALVERQPYMTRFYTRVSPEEMTQDPMFDTAPELGDVDGVIDLSTREPQDVCEPIEPVSPCAFLYCGEGAVCGETSEGAAGCRCETGTVARTVTPAGSGGFGGFGGGGALEVGCVDEVVNVMPPEASEAGCAGVTCGGRGACIAINGVPACRCDAGTIAVADDFELGGVACRQPSVIRENEIILAGDLRRLDGLGGAPRGGLFCGAQGAATPVAAFAILLMLIRRRRHATTRK